LNHRHRAASHRRRGQRRVSGGVAHGGAKRKEIYKYEAPWPVYSMNWSARPDKGFRLALGSFVEEYNNKVQIVCMEDDRLTPKCLFDHPYPTTKVMWLPDAKNAGAAATCQADLLATSGDYLRVWRVADSEAKLECLLNNNKNSDFCAPLTSFDWNETDPNIIGTASIDTTCTIWGLETGQAISRVVSGHVKTQLIAHDKKKFTTSRSAVRATVATSSPALAPTVRVRMFDLRHLEHSTIIYEDPSHSALLRLAWKRQDPNYLATFAADSNEVALLDTRVPCTPVAKLTNHRPAPCPGPVDDPILAYTAAGEINQVQWGSLLTDWIAICYNNCLEVLRDE
uniref:WD_REPEATS_REGION domain-containing protein n=1 Tax=Macrostomum lignano TaxID=282301 RepID=A0A1I8F6K8_9PLAT